MYDIKMHVSELEQKLQLFWEAKRLETFTSWPYGDDKPCSAPKLAEAGFYYTGNKNEPDAVQCFLCEKALDGWDENDDPWTEHFNHSKQCMFAKARQPEQALTFPQMSSINKELIDYNVKKYSNQYVADKLKDLQTHDLKTKSGLATWVKRNSSVSQS